LISLVIPNLNEASCLKKFLFSLVNQSFQDFELVLIDGGSTDKSREIVDSFELDHPGMRITKLLDKTPNIGYIRNLGALCSRGDLMFHSSSDVILDPFLLENVFKHFLDPRLVSLTGRTKPVSSQLLCHIAYQSFDLLRCVFSLLPGSLRKYRPGGNFMVIRKNVFDAIGGFPEVTINEDGLLGQNLDLFLLENNSGSRVKFDLNLCVYHHVKRFEQKGSIKTILFYLYVLGNMAPMLKPLLYKLEAHSGEIFKNRSDLRDFSGRKKD